MKYTGNEALGLEAASVNTGINIYEVYKIPRQGAEMAGSSVFVGYSDPTVTSIREKPKIKELISLWIEGSDRVQ